MTTGAAALSTGLGPRLRALVLSACSICAIGACSGEITQSGGAPRSDDGSPSASASATGKSGNAADLRIAQRVWRLSPSQFNAETVRLFGAGAAEVMIPETAA